MSVDLQFVMLNAETSVAAGKKSDVASLFAQDESGFDSVFADEMAEQMATGSQASATALGQEIAASAEVSALLRQKVSLADAGKTPELLPVLPTTEAAVQRVAEGANALLTPDLSTPDAVVAQEQALLSADAGEAVHNETPLLGAEDSPWLALISAAEQYTASLVSVEANNTSTAQTATELLPTASTAQETDVAFLAGKSNTVSLALSGATTDTSATQDVTAGLTQAARTPDSRNLTPQQATEPAVIGAAMKSQPELIVDAGVLSNASQPGVLQSIPTQSTPAPTVVLPSDDTPGLTAQNAAESMTSAVQTGSTTAESQATPELADKTSANNKSAQSRAEGTVTTPQPLQQQSQAVPANVLSPAAVVNTEPQPILQAMTNAAQLSFADHQKAVNAADALSKQQQLKAEQVTLTDVVSALGSSQPGRSDAFNAAMANVAESQFSSLAANAGDKSQLLTPTPSAQSPALASQQNQAASQLTALKTAEAQLPTLYLQEPQAAAQLKDRVMYQVQQKIQSAEIRLAPEELGSVQIKVNLQQDQLSVQFVVQQAQAKEALEQQMPRLRDLLQQQGVELTDSQVSQQQQQQQQPGEQQGRASGPQLVNTELVEEALPQQVTIRSSDRMVDYYA